MDIEIIGQSDEKTIKSLETIFTEVFKLMEADPSCLEKIYIAPNEKYGETIKSIDPDEGHTESDVAIGMAKTIAHYNGKSSVVFRSDIVQGYVYLLQGEKNNSLHQCQYAVFHEFGHCVDNHKRNVQKSLITQESLKEKFKIQMLKEYYCHILEGEFAACVHSAMGASNPMYQEDISRSNGYYQDLLKKLDEHKEKYAADANHLGYFAYDAAGIFWFLLIDYAKLVGTQIGDSERLKDVDNMSWENLPMNMGEVLDEFKQYLISAWESYPQWPEGFYDGLFIYWQALTIGHGFNFVEGEQGDGMYF